MDFDVDESIEEVNTLLNSTLPQAPSRWQARSEPLELSTSLPRPSIVSPPSLELKPLPSHLKYVLLGPSETLPVIVSTDLNDTQEKHLLTVLKNHKGALGWSMADLKGISPSVV